MQLARDAALPSWATAGLFFSITRTEDELSVICEERLVPSELRREGGWRCLALAGPFDFSVVGVAAEFTSILAAANVSVLVISTYETDYVLVKEEALDRAAGALRDANYEVLM